MAHFAVFQFAQADLGHTLAGTGVSLELSMNFEAVTARYVDVRLERKKEVLDAYHNAVGKSSIRLVGNRVSVKKEIALSKIRAIPTYKNF